MSAETRPHGEPWRDADRLRALYIGEGLTVHEVAAHLDCAPITISRWLDRHGIETRSGGKQNEYSDAELIDHLQSANGNCDLRVTRSHINAIDGPSASTYAKRFGSWGDALELARIDADAPTQATPPRRATTDRDKGNYLSRHRRVARELVRADPPVRRRELGLSESDFYRCVSDGLLVKHSDTPVKDPETDDYSWLWEAPDGVVKWIEHSMDLTGDCPAADCPSRGVRNLGDGEYTCTDDDCDARFDRETAEEVLGR